jgi:hypothetical protein
MRLVDKARAETKFATDNAESIRLKKLEDKFKKFTDEVEDLILEASRKGLYNVFLHEDYWECQNKIEAWCTINDFKFIKNQWSGFTSGINYNDPYAQNVQSRFVSGSSMCISWHKDN